ncbi:methylated-DNA--[protein]-cysteine S-methyltransferase [Melissococcus plutonius]|uniref:methylated-DNA--[protein]-cysteine S-methyltransferase n=1 Tax=Melissococcus plutonius TaxID=33970 RepID=UPI003EE76E40
MKIFTPIGPIWLNANNEGLTQLSFNPILHTIDNRFTRQAADELTEYFLGKRKLFTVSLSITIGTPFQQLIWQILKEIPYHKTMTYSEIAEKIGNPKAIRAIGQANSKNPLPIIIPCHRVIGKNGKLTGYLGTADKDGLQLKQQLLKIEGISVPDY